MGDRGRGEEIAAGGAPGVAMGIALRRPDARVCEVARGGLGEWSQRRARGGSGSCGSAGRGPRSAGCDRREGAGGREHARRGAHLSESEDIVEVGAAGSAAGDARRAGRASAPEPEDVVVVAGWPRGARGRRDQGRAAARG